MDAGANLVVTPDDLELFAYIRSYYMEKLHGISTPRIGLVNNGTEHNKGLPLQQEAYAKLKDNEQRQKMAKDSDTTMHEIECNVTQKGKAMIKRMKDRYERD